MKKLFLFIALIPLLSASCGGSSEGGDGKGDLTIAASVKTDVENVDTRATPTDYLEYTLVLDGPDGIQKYDYPADHTLRGLRAGNYSVTLTSHPDGIPSCSFDCRVFSATKTAAIADGATSNVQLDCVQANSGVCFRYDAALADNGFGGIVATVSHHSGSELVYDGDNRNAKGYFAPGQVEITLKQDGQPIPIGGQDSKKLTLVAKKDYTVIISVDEGSSGAEIKVTVEAVDTETGEESFALTSGDNDNTKYTIQKHYQAQYYGGTVTSKFQLDMYTIESNDVFTGLVIEGFSDLADYRNFSIKPGTYRIGTSGNVKTFMPGSYDSATGAITGTFYYIMVGSGIVEVALIDAGEVDVILSEGVYTVKARVSGVNLSNGSEVTYNYKLESKLAFNNYYFPQTDLLFTDIPKCTHASTGTSKKLKEGSPDNWSGTVTPLVEGDYRYYYIFNWGGEEVGYYVDYYKGNLVIDSDAPIGTIGDLVGYFVACYVRDDNMVKFLRNFPVEYDASSKTLKFYGKGEDKNILFGIFGRDKYNNGVGFLSELYEDASVALNFTRSMASASPGRKVDGIRFDYVTGVYTIDGVSFDEGRGIAPERDAASAYVFKR